MRAQGLWFEWDSKKSAANVRKHGVSFHEASTLFSDPNEVMLSDPDHSQDEERFISIGQSSTGQVMLACYTETDNVVRLISVRLATAAERRTYESGSEEDA